MSKIIAKLVNAIEVDNPPANMFSLFCDADDKNFKIRLEDGSIETLAYNRVRCQQSISSDGILDFKLLKGYSVKYIIKETNGNSAGNVSLGITPGGTEIGTETILANQTVAAPKFDSLYDYASDSVDQDLYISSDGWGSGVVTVTIIQERFVI